MIQNFSGGTNRMVPGMLERRNPQIFEAELR